MGSVHHVNHAKQQIPEARVKGQRGQPQLDKSQPINRGEMKEILDNLISELANAINNFRESHGGKLSGVAISADQGAKYALSCAEYLQRKI